ncbi:hypothetical protein [Pseudobacteroides cellulosolvens]|uniref:Uncharacterized protein n=1 Tax=Pseudobacteroides cellulosolvens ATCC 35603 = DSM 2933 TaxID=398512 RepID=A0A0L6JWT6_9FIRM|nr:hypothetical protein [Pseudobacteroides cellulosolvens]KNY30316.1 hypothetical protein Bccel_5596 [Pseudobacteroides cellulosolvens ATCC 35603 = DSM 2933]
MNKKSSKIVAFLMVITLILSVGLNSFAWSSDINKNPENHKSLVTGLSSSYFTKDGVNYKTIVANAAIYTDSEDYMDASSIQKVGNSYIISPYHAKANLSCTTVQATSTTNSSSHGYSFTTVLNTASFLYDLAQTGIQGYSINLNPDSYTSNVEKRIVQDLQKLINNKFSGTTSYTKKGFIILGVFLHLIQDVYAHRASVTVDRIKNIGSANFSNYSGAINAANSYNGIVMIRLKDYGPKASSFEDNSDYWPERYSAAESATLDQVTRITSNSYFSFNRYGINLK